jgi:hypothetical protein
MEQEIFNKEQCGEDCHRHLIEQYKIYIESIEHSSNRRQKTNDFFLTVNTALLAFMGVFNRVTENNSPFAVLLAAAVGVSLCFFWYRLIKSYRDSNRGKYKVVHKMEEHLPASPYKNEWSILKEGADKKTYFPITHVEIKIPWVFMCFYIVFAVIKYLNVIL